MKTDSWTINQKIHPTDHFQKNDKAMNELRKFPDAKNFEGVK